MARIGLMTIGHKDYPVDIALRFASELKASLQERGVDVITYDEAIVSHKMALHFSRELLKEDIDGVVLFLGTWIEAPIAMTALREIEHLPFAIWGIPMFEYNGREESTGSFVSFAMLKGSLKRLEYIFNDFLGLPDDEDTLEDLISFCRAAHAKKRLKRARIGLVGYASMGIYPGTFDHLMLRRYIGPEVEHIDTFTLINRMNHVADLQCKVVFECLKSRVSVDDDVTEESLMKVVRMYLALKEIAEDREVEAVNVKCQYELSKEYGMVACVPLSLLTEDGFVASCEGDIPCTVSQLMLAYVSGSVTAYGDVLNFNKDGTFKLSPCGFIPFSMGNETELRLRNFMPGVGFSGVQNSFCYRPGKVTLLRLVEDKCDYHLLLMTGEGVSTPLRQGYMPAIDIKPDGSLEKMMGNFGGQHFAMCYGDYANEIHDLAKLLGIGIIGL